MYSSIVKVISLAVLILAAFVMLQGASRILVQLVVCGGALFVIMEAARSRKYVWVAAFGVPFVCFNPIFPVVFSRPASLAIALLCALMFLGSLRYLRPAPRMSLASITDLPARGESL